MPRVENPKVKALMAQGFPRRQAYRMVKLAGHPVAHQMFQQERLSLADAAGLATRWPYHGEQCLLAFHVVNGYRLRDAEAAYLSAVRTAIAGLDSALSDEEMLWAVDKAVAEPVRQLYLMPSP